MTEITSKVLTKRMLVSPSLHNRFKHIMVCYFGTHFHGSQIKPSRRCWNTCFTWVLLLCPPLIHSFIHSFIPLPSAECDDSLPFSGASSISLCYIPFPSTLFHQLVFQPLSLHLAIYFLVYLSALFPKSHIILFLGILFSSILCTCPNQCNLFNLIVSVIVGFLCYVWVVSTTARKKLHHT